MAIYLTEEDVRRLLPIDEAIETVEQGLREQGNGTGVNIPRHRVQAGGRGITMMLSVLGETAAWPGSRLWAQEEHWSCCTAKSLPGSWRSCKREALARYAPAQPQAWQPGTWPVRTPPPSESSARGTRP